MENKDLQKKEAQKGASAQSEQKPSPMVDKEIPSDNSEGCVLEKELNPKDLIFEDENLLKLIDKPFSLMTKEEKAKLPKAKLKMIRRKNNFTRETKITARVILSIGVYLDKELKPEEYQLLKRYHSELFQEVKNKALPSCEIPIKLYANVSEDSDYIRFRYNAELCPGVVGRYKRGNKFINYLNEKQIQLLLIDETPLRFVRKTVDLREEFDDLEDE